MVNMITQLELMDMLRENYKIPKEFECFNIHYEEMKHLVAQTDIKPTKLELNYDIDDAEYKKAHVGIDHRSIALKYDNFYIFSLQIYQIGDIDRICCLFIKRKDIDRFCEKYFLGQEFLGKEQFNISPGFYTVESQMFGGNTLVNADVSDIEEPILNNDLNNILKNEIIAFTKKQKQYEEHKLEYKRGILLYGLPGMGKTAFIKTFCKQIKAISILLDKNDMSATNYVKKLLASEALKDKLKIVVIEDIDGMHAGVRSELLNFLDVVSPCHKTIFIATTNFPENLDIAITNRPSRFDSVYKVEAPNEQSRKQLIQKFFPDITKKELDKAIKETDGFSGAYFKELFVYSFLTELKLLDAIEAIKERMKLFPSNGKVSDGDSYFG
jgi:hypothetical protein